MKKAAKKSSKADSLAAKRIADAEKAEQANKGVTNVEPQDVVTYASQKAALRREYESKLREAETELARRYAKDAKKFLAEHIEGSKDEVLKGLWSDYVEASRHSDGGVVTQSAATSNEGGERRTRRSAEQQKADAEKILELVKDAGSEGISATDLSTKLKDEGIDATGGAAAFVKKILNVELRTEGQRRGARYFAK